MEGITSNLDFYLSLQKTEYKGTIQPLYFKSYQKTSQQNYEYLNSETPLPYYDDWQLLCLYLLCFTYMVCFAYVVTKIIFIEGR